MNSLNHARLDGAEWSVVLEHAPGSAPIWRHLGKRFDGAPPDTSQRWRAKATFSLDRSLGQPVLPTRGLGWLGPAALDLRTPNGLALAVDFTECTIEENSDCLTLALTDPVSRISATVELRQLPGEALRLMTSIENRGDGPVLVARMASAVIPLPASMRELRSWRGVHAAEFDECREPMPAHAWVRQTRRGIGGHGGPPGFYCLADGATRHNGLVFALQLAWSGDSLFAIERNDEGGWIASAEARLEPGELTLAPGARHVAPPAYLAISNGGSNGAMAQQHAAVRTIVKWPGSTMRPRPVHLNTWEACYFDHDEARLMGLVESAAALGVERFVLDDGWFAGRRDDRRGLGDWIVDRSIYPQGLGRLAHKVETLGMEFGLWVEPEMISPDSDLYRAHPDWALALPGRERPTARHQLVLDLRRPDVRDHLFGALDRLLREAPIRYLKWDHNRDLAPPAGAAQAIGTYDLLSRLRDAHPRLEIESCAGGGGRTDAGIAAYTHRFWTSDNLDAVSRVAIQRGFVSFLPPEMMGAHVGAIPAHATGRSQSLDFRAAIACMGHFGLELDPTYLSDHDRTELSRWIKFYKEWRHVVHGGQVYIGESEDGVLWQAHRDGDQCLLFVIRTAPPLLRRPPPLRLHFARGGEWNVRLLRQAGVSRGLGVKPWEVGDRHSARFGGDWLASVGLPLPPATGESAGIFHMEFLDPL